MPISRAQPHGRELDRRQAHLLSARIGTARWSGPDRCDPRPRRALRMRSRGRQDAQGRFHGREPVRRQREDADLTEAVLADAELPKVRAEGAKLTRAILQGQPVGRDPLARRSLRRRRARRELHQGRVRRSGPHRRTVAGLIGAGASLADIRAEWLDTSAEGDGSKRVAKAMVAPVLSGRPHRAEQGAMSKRYFGRGDVLRNASLEFGDGAIVEIESLFEQCTISLGKGTELVVGPAGVLSDCQIRGRGTSPSTVTSSSAESRHRGAESARRERERRARRRGRATPGFDPVRVRAGLQAPDEDLEAGTEAKAKAGRPTVGGHDAERIRAARKPLSRRAPSSRDRSPRVARSWCAGRFEGDVTAPSLA